MTFPGFPQPCSSCGASFIGSHTTISRVVSTATCPVAALLVNLCPLSCWHQGDVPSLVPHINLRLRLPGEKQLTTTLQAPAEATLFHTQPCHWDVFPRFPQLCSSCGALFIWSMASNFPTCSYSLCPAAALHVIWCPTPSCHQGSAQRSSPGSSHHFATQASQLGLRPQYFPKEVSSQVPASILHVYFTLMAPGCAQSPVPALAFCRSHFPAMALDLGLR